MSCSAVLLLLGSNLRARSLQLIAASIANSLAAGVLLAALVGQQIVYARAPLAAQSLIASNEVHLAATDPAYPYLDESSLEEMRSDPRVSQLTTAVSVRAVDMPGLQTGELDRDTFYSRGARGGGGWITGRRDLFLAWDEGGPRGNLLDGRWPSPTETDPIEIVVPKMVWDQWLDSWRRLESDSGVHRGHVVGIIQVDSGQVATQQGARLTSRQISREAAEMLTGRLLRPSDARLVFHRAEEKSSFLQDWRKRLPSLPGGMELWDSATIEEAGLRSPMAESARLAVQTAVLFASACVVCIALSAQGNAVRHRAGQLGLLRALGAGRGTLVAVVLGEAVALALVGSAGAVGVVWAATKGAAALVPALIPPAFPDIFSVLLMAAVVLLGVLAGSIWPALVASQVRPGELTNAEADPSRAARFARDAALLAAVVAAATTCIVLVTPAESLARATVLAWVGIPGLALTGVLITPLTIRLVCQLCVRPMAWLTRTDSLVLYDQVASDGARSAGSVVAVALGLGGFIWMLTWGASMLNAFVIDPAVPRWLVSIHPYGLDQEEAEQLLSSPTFRGYHPLTLVDTRLENEGDLDDAVPTLVMGLDVDRALGSGPDALPFKFVDGERSEAVAELKQGNACLVSAWYAASHHTRVGDQVSVAVPATDGVTKRTYRVAGVVELRGWRMATKQNKVRLNGDKHEAMLVLNADAVRRDFPVAAVNFLLGNPVADASGHIPGFRSDLPIEEANIASNHERDALEASVTSAIDLSRPVTHQPEMGMIVQVDSRVVQVDDLDRTRSALWGEWGGEAVKRLGQLPLVILVLSLFSVSGTLVISLWSRARELGVLRSCGMTRLAMLRLCLAEGMLVGLSAIPVAAFFGGGGAWIALQIAGIVGYRLDFAGIKPEFMVPWEWLWPGAVATAIVCCLAALWASWRVGRVSPAILITYASR